MIEIRNVTKKYASRNKKETTALKNVSFVLPDKGFVYTLGKSGSGKSTLLNILSYLDSPTKGEIIVDGKSLRISQKPISITSVRLIADLSFKITSSSTN